MKIGREHCRKLTLRNGDREIEVLYYPNDIDITEDLKICGKGPYLFRHIKARNLVDGSFSVPSIISNYLELEYRDEQRDKDSSYFCAHSFRRARGLESNIRYYRFHNSVAACEYTLLCASIASCYEPSQKCRELNDCLLKYLDKIPNGGDLPSIEKIGKPYEGLLYK